MNPDIYVTQKIIEDLKDDVKNSKEQKKSIEAELVVLDAYVDEIDYWIQKIDAKIPELTQQINLAIQKVKDTYDSRIAIGCSSGLSWEQVGNSYYVHDLEVLNFKFWEVQKNKDTEIEYQNYGVRYFRKPLNRDYGTSIIKEIVGSIGVNTSILSIVSSGGTIGISTGDYITDNIISSSIFPTGHSPQIIGFGNTTHNFYTDVIGGNISSGSTLFIHVGVGSTTNIDIGNTFYKEGYTTASTKVVGFGTTSTTVTVIDYTSGTPTETSISIIASTVILSEASLGIGTNISFNVGIASTVPTLILDKLSENSAYGSDFTVVRIAEDISKDFDYTKNPLNPVTVGIIDQTTLGFGDKLELINNGYPPITKQWNTSIEENPPDVGMGKVIYNEGTLNWPVIINCPGGICSSTYVSEGTISIANTTTSIGSTSSSPTGLSPSSPICVSYASSISEAKLELERIQNNNIPIIENLIEASLALRKLRDKKELYAWSLLQSSSYLSNETETLDQSLQSLINTDFTSFES